MQHSRRAFLQRLATVASVLAGGTALSGCLGGGSGSDSGGTSTAATPTSTSAPATASTAATTSTPSTATPAPAQNVGPVWQPSPTIEFVEGVPSQVSVRQFVQDPNNDPLLISMQSGSLPPGIMWNPNTATIEYDGRPLGATASAPAVVSGVVFVADDGRP
jgi:hypothetical protein